MSELSIIITHTLNVGIDFEKNNEHVNITRGMVRERAVELAVFNGRKPHEACKSDWESAKREMVGLQET